MFVATFGIYTKSGSIMGCEYRDIEAESLEDARDQAEDMLEELEENHPCVMLDDLEEVND